MTSERLTHVLDEADWTPVPEHLHAGIRAYFEHGRLPGHFLTAVLKNDLCGAVIRADHVNRTRLADIVEFLAGYAPAVAWGSPAQVEAWVRRARSVTQDAGEGQATP